MSVFGEDCRQRRAYDGVIFYEKYRGHVTDASTFRCVMQDS
jgi:hypothetical protein